MAAAGTVEPSRRRPPSVILNLHIIYVFIHFYFAMQKDITGPSKRGYMDTIHARLKRYRQQRGLTIQEVSSRTGIPASTYKEWENGRQIRGEPYLLLAEVYQVSIQELITGQKNKSTSLLARFDALEAELQNIKTELISYL